MKLKNLRRIYENYFEYRKSIYKKIYFYNKKNNIYNKLNIYNIFNSMTLYIFCFVLFPYIYFNKYVINMSNTILFNITYESVKISLFGSIKKIQLFKGILKSYFYISVPFYSKIIK
jgi:hypothetical protein